MPLPKWVTAIPAMLPPALRCCSPVPMQTDGPHHYQTSTPLRVEVQTGINRGGKTKSSAWIGSVSTQGSAVHICNSNAKASAPRQACAGPGTSVSLHMLTTEEVVSDSRWGCGPIRARVLGNDEWGWLMEPRRNTDRGKTPAAVSRMSINTLRVSSLKNNVANT